MEKYFFLNRHCFLCLGLYGAAIYNLYKRELYSIDLKIGKILKEIKEKKLTIIEAADKVNIVKFDEVFNKLNEINAMNLGFFTDEFIIVENLLPSRSEVTYKLNYHPKPLRKIWLEVETRCNFKCVHCNLAGRCYCTKSNDQYNKSSLDFLKYKKIIEDSKILNCQEIHIHGGEPLLDITKTLNIIRYAKKMNIPNIILQSNGYLLNKQLIRVMKKFNVTLLLPFFSEKSEIYDSITNISGSYNKVLENLKYAILKKLKINIIIEVINENYKHIADTIKYLENLGIKKIWLEPLLTQDKSYNSTFSNHLFKTEQNLHGVSKDTYFRNIDGNPCWDSKLAITINGDVIPPEFKFQLQQQFFLKRLHPVT